MEYLLKSDVMAVFDNNSGFILDMRRDIDALPTFPNPSLAVEVRYISPNLLNALAQELGHPPRGGLTSISIGNVTFIKSVLNAPAPSVAAPESGNSKLLEMIAKAEWLNVKVVNPKELAMNVCFIRDSIAEVCNGMREIARLLAQRGDK